MVMMTSILNTYMCVYIYIYNHNNNNTNNNNKKKKNKNNVNNNNNNVNNNNYPRGPTSERPKSRAGEVHLNANHLKTNWLDKFHLLHGNRICSKKKSSSQVVYVYVSVSCSREARLSTSRARSGARSGAMYLDIHSFWGGKQKRSGPQSHFTTQRVTPCRPSI